MTEVLTSREPAEVLHEVRQNLFRAHRFHERRATRYVNRVNVTPTENDAGTSALMAMTYSYVLAAVLAHMNEAFGVDAAADMARFVEEMLRDGDFDDVNSDLRD